MNDDEIDKLPSLQEVQLSRAKLDLKIRNREFRDYSGRWEHVKHLLAAPAFLAAVVPAVIALCVTVATIVIDNYRTANETNKSILLGITKSGDSTRIASQLKLFLDTGVIDDSNGRFEATQAKLQDEMQQQILLNILRQSQNEPLSFDEVKLDANFLEGFLKPMDLQILDYFLRQGFPREVLFWMFMDSIKIRSDGDLIQFQYDPAQINECPPEDLKRRCFRDFVLTTVAAGLSVEEQTLFKPVQNGHGGETTVFARFCFDSALQRKAKTNLGDVQWTQAISKAFDVSISDYQPVCGTSWDAMKELDTPQSDTFKFNIGPITVQIALRSALSWFDFLGSLAKLQIPVGKSPMITNPRLPKMSTTPDDANLFTVYKIPKTDPTRMRFAVKNKGPESIAADCFARTPFHTDDYCVPVAAGNSKRIFGLLGLLIGIQTIHESPNGNNKD